MTNKGSTGDLTAAGRSRRSTSATVKVAGPCLENRFERVGLRRRDQGRVEVRVALREVGTIPVDVGESDRVAIRRIADKREHSVRS